MASRADFELWGSREVARLLSLVESERGFYQDLISAVPTPVIVVNAGSAVTWANRAFLRLFNLRVEDLRSKEIEQVLPIAGLTAWIRAAGERQPLSAQVQDAAVRITAIPVGAEDDTMLVVEQSASTTLTAASTGHRAERMEAMQAVAGRLAHDLNNPLMIVTGYSEEVLEALAANHPVRAEVTEILEAARRIASVASRLTEFARKDAKPARPLDLTALIAGLEKRVKEAAGEGVTLAMEPAEGPVLALADAGQLEQVILTLASKDLESAPRRTHLSLDCSTETIAARKYACVTLRDNGRGLDAAKQAAVFESGLTAKVDSPEAHSGMALARAYNLVRQWGGDIEFSSRQPQGSEYRVYLPQPESSPVPESQSVPAAESGTPTVLVVDDEAGIRGLVRKILRREGYRVLEAASAEEALGAGRGQRVDLLITDVMLPGMQGSELARKMYQANSRLKVLYISGFTPDESVRSAAFPPGAGFLSKPFTLAALLERVRAGLNK